MQLQMQVSIIPLHVLGAAQDGMRQPPLRPTHLSRHSIEGLRLPMIKIQEGLESERGSQGAGLGHKARWLWVQMLMEYRAPVAVPNSKTHNKNAAKR